MIRFAIRLAFGAVFVVAKAAAGVEFGQPVSAIAMHGRRALSVDFSHLSYVNSEAPKGGRLILGYLGEFDSLNPYNIKALSTAQGLVGNIYHSLMVRSGDEPFTLYGLIAESLETDAACDAIVFHLNPAAHFSDGLPVTSTDVLFTFSILKVQYSEGERPAAATRRLWACQERRRAGRSDRALRSFRCERSRIAADARDDAGPVQRPHGRRTFEDQTLQISI